MIDEYELNFFDNKKPGKCFPTEEGLIDIIEWLLYWKAAVPDEIYDLNIKKMSSLHAEMYKIIRRISLEGNEVDD